MIMIGLVSAIVDNVPLVAASMGMYSLAQYPPDSFLWEFIAYCAGTGGSILIIGSAAGVAAMGSRKSTSSGTCDGSAGSPWLGYLAGRVGLHPSVPTAALTAAAVLRHLATRTRLQRLI